LLLQASGDLNLEIFIDIHAHSTMTNAFMYGNSHEFHEQQEREAQFPKLLDKQVSDFSLGNTQFNTDSSKAGSARR
jgi:hypothetical protein